jgi:Uma2 family endonuclease
MSTAPKYNPHYTIDDYRMWEGDWELWNGVAVAMTPSPFGKHGYLLAKIASALSNAIDDVDCNASVLVEVDWIITRDTIVRPNLSIVCGDPPERHIENPPALVVEILSASTRERDLTVKRRLFEQESVAWYLIMDPDRDTLQALRLKDAGVYEQVTFTDRLEVDLCDSCSLSVRLNRLFG